MLRFLACLAIPLLVLAVPTALLPIDGMTVLEHRVLAIFLMAVLLWVFEPIPIFATSVLVIFLELLLISDRGVQWNLLSNTAQFGKPISHKAIMATFASPVILLFLGGFFLAAAATKHHMDLNLARVLLRPFGKRPSAVLLGLMVITAVFSMFMSNTATTAMMLALLMPVLNLMPEDDRGRTAFALCIPFAANIGGIGTPIGTPPNAVAQKYLVGHNAISFVEWMAFSVPYVVVLLLITWGLLLWMFPGKTKEMVVDINSKWDKSWKALVVYATFVVTIFLWIFSKLLGSNLSAAIIAMLPVTVFCATGIITVPDLKKMEWDVLWLVAGGIALGLGMEATGLSKHMIQSIPFQDMGVYTIIVVGAVVSLLMSTFVSNTAMAALILPIMAALGTGVPEIRSMGGGQMMVLTCTYACSLAMAMPISTPPNALVYSMGLLKGSEMNKAGGIVGIFGILLLFAMIALLYTMKFFSTVHTSQVEITTALSALV